MERAQPREDDREDIPTHASACGSARLRLMRNRVKVVLLLVVVDGTPRASFSLGSGNHSDEG